MFTVASAISLFIIPVTLILLVRYQKRRLAAFHRAVTNRLATPFARRLPGFGVVTNIGRISGRLYRTPVNVFRSSDGFLIALTYGRDSDWIKNVMAAARCQLETRGVTYQLSHPRLVHDPARSQFPFLVRIVLRFIDANDCLQLSICHTLDSNSQSDIADRGFS